MGNILTWNDVSFFANTSQIYGLGKMTISAGCETEGESESSAEYVKRKSGSPYEVTLTAILGQFLGVDVQSEAMKLAEHARLGDTGYLYTGENKLLPSPLMMTGAKVNDIKFKPNGEWLYCEVELTLKQCEKLGGTAETGANSKAPNVDVDAIRKAMNAQLAQNYDPSTGKMKETSTSGVKIRSAKTVEGSAAAANNVTNAAKASSAETVIANYRNAYTGTGSGSAGVSSVKTLSAEPMSTTATKITVTPTVKSVKVNQVKIR